MNTSRETLKMIFGKERVENNYYEVVRWIVENPKGYRQKVLECCENIDVVNPEVCRNCGGSCCLRAPCHLSPDDIEDLSYEGLKKLLKEKKYISVLRFPGCVCDSCLRTIEYSGIHFYILRTRTRGTGIAADATKIKKNDLCMLLNPDGCSISFEERPLGAKLLIPEKYKSCTQLYDLDDCLFDWKDHQDVLRRLFHYFKLVEMLRL